MLERFTLFLLSVGWTMAAPPNIDLACVVRVGCVCSQGVDLQVQILLWLFIWTCKSRLWVGFFDMDLQVQILGELFIWTCKSMPEFGEVLSGFMFTPWIFA